MPNAPDSPVRSCLGWEVPLEKEMATRQYSYLENSMDRGAYNGKVPNVRKVEGGRIRG